MNLIMHLPEQISGYFPVPINVSSDDTPTYHIIYIRKHQSNDKKSEASSTVFVVNLPLDTTTDHLKHLCQSLGGVNAKEFRHTYGHRWQIELIDKSACNRFLSKAKAQNFESGEQIEWPSPKMNGTQYYINKNLEKYIDQDDLQARVDEDMEKFSQAEEEKQNELNEMANQIDDDGFTLVVGSKTQDKESIAPPTKEIKDNSSKKRKKNKEKTDFYRFQLREQKKTEMNNLLKRFQDDKQKVKDLREKRRFKPY